MQKISFSGGYYPAGLLSILIHVPAELHQYVPGHILRSYQEDNHEEAHELEQHMFPEDIPVFTRKYTTGISEATSQKLEATTQNLTGRKAIEQIHPWILNILMCDFDNIICTCPLKQGEPL